MKHRHAGEEVRVKKKLLFAYDCMAFSGTTTALLSLLQAIDYDRYDVDVILYRNEGDRLSALPPQVRLLPPAATSSAVPEKLRKLWLSFWNGQLFRALWYCLRTRHDPAKKRFMTIWQATEPAHAKISRRLPDHYDAAIGFIESWGDHYAVSDRVDADKRIIWIHPDVNKSYLIPELNYRLLYKKADHIVTVSEECRAHMAAHLPRLADRVCCVENMVDVSGIRALADAPTEFVAPTDVLKLVTVCRIDYSSKALDRTLRVMKRLLDEGCLDRLRWYWIGDGVDMPQAKQYIQANGLAEHVILLGAQSNPFVYEKQMDIFFLPSRFEGKPCAVNEAQVLGLPCAVTRYAAAAEQVTDGVDGIIMENTEQAIYEFLHHLCANEYDVDVWRTGAAAKSFDNVQAIREIERLLA